MRQTELKKRFRLAETSFLIADVAEKNLICIFLKYYFQKIIWAVENKAEVCMNKIIT
jgi:hypothetical protein